MRTWAGLATLVLGCALSGCSGSEEAPPLPPVPSASASPVAAPSPPAEALAETSEGAEQFARYFFDNVNLGFRTGSSSAVRDLSAPGCEGCESLIRLIDELHAKEHKRAGGDYELQTVTAPPVERGDVVLLVTYDRSASRVVDNMGKVFATAAPVPLTTAQMRLIRSGGTWHVQGYRTVQT